MKEKIRVFDIYAAEYDSWFETHKYAYQSELEAVKKFIPEHGLGIDIGCGTGRFSTPFSIPIGVEPSKGMAKIAESRGMTVHNTTSEELPFCKEHFDFVLLINTICFVNNAVKTLIEIRKILKPGGNLITAIIDKTSDLGKVYESIKKEDKFYRYAKFYSVDEVSRLLTENGFKVDKTYQTIFSNPNTMNSPDPVVEGYGKGAFVVINSIKSY